jgi:hypothetical protein
LDEHRDPGRGEKISVTKAIQEVISVSGRLIKAQTFHDIAYLEEIGSGSSQ